MGLLEKLHADGHPSKRVASTGGGEWAGPCPWCGGRDRFHVWPASDQYWCRGCDEKGDEIEYLRRQRGLSYPEAAEEAGKALDDDWKPRRATKRPIKKELLDPVPAAPWRTWVADLINETSISQGDCSSDRGVRSARNWLRSRGMHDKTIEKFKLGWIPRHIYPIRAELGLDDRVRDDGSTSKKTMIPMGISIPAFGDDGLPVRLRVRQPRGQEPKYLLLTGSKVASLVIFSGEVDTPLILVESELDAIALSEAIPWASVAALGSTSARYERRSLSMDRAIDRSSKILLWLDHDEPGRKCSIRWTMALMADKNICEYATCEKFKDPGDALTHGFKVEDWVSMYR